MNAAAETAPTAATLLATRLVRNAAGATIMWRLVDHGRVRGRQLARLEYIDVATGREVTRPWPADEKMLRGIKCGEGCAFLTGWVENAAAIAV